ncbi:autoinducer binding domain-containing protein [uncultured Roseovarius sp.]|uniref:autoinducer binding domain-containing protein n=1 Tax=uncultured Roseovarius sp. TaxID=293344 RepID=UPI0026035486|nr:autoinducer binding domain-containing protein [uncultured Roseovarius sp.]
MSEETIRGLKRIAELIEDIDVHPFRTTELSDIGEELSECTDLTELSELMWQAATTVGFQNFAIFVIQQGSNGAFRSRICTSYKDTWVNRYHEKAYQFIDPVIAQAAAEDGWFLFSELNSSAPAIECFWEDAETFGIGRNGLCFSISRKDGARIGVSFSTSNTKEKVEEVVRLNGFDLQFLAHLAVDCFCYASRGPSLSDDTLSLKELRFLYTLASSPDPTEALEISAGYGSNKALQSSIRQKLSVDTVFQALAIVSAKGWFNQLPFDQREVAKPFPALVGFGTGDPMLEDTEKEKSETKAIRLGSDQEV